MNSGRVRRVLRVTTLHCVACRPSLTGAADHSQTDTAGGDHRQGALWRGVAGPLARRARGCQDLLVARGKLLVPGGGDLPDGHAAP